MESLRGGCDEGLVPRTLARMRLKILDLAEMGRSSAAPLRGTLPLYWFDRAYYEDPGGCAQYCHYAGDYEDPEKIAGALND